MSETGWREFVASDGVGDWVVLHGGPCAVFDVSTLAEAAELAEAVAHVVGADSVGMALTATASQLTVRLTRDMWQTERSHVEHAARISALARERGVTANRRAVQEVQLAIAAQSHQIDVGFWRAVLGYAPASDDNAIDPLATGSTVWMQELSAEKHHRHAMHVDVSVSREDAIARVDAAIAAGGRVVVDESPASWILSDPAGNKVCIAAWPDGAEPLEPPAS